VRTENKRARKGYETETKRTMRVEERKGGGKKGKRPEQRRRGGKGNAIGKKEPKKILQRCLDADACFPALHLQE
jgi:hypothetical protein